MAVGILAGSSIQETAYNLVQTTGTPLTRRTTLNFTGAGVTVTDTAGVTQVDFSGGGAGTCAALGGDVTGSCAANTVAKVNGVAYPASPSTHQLAMITAANTATYKTMPDCNGALKAIQFTQSTDLFSCLTGTAQQRSISFVIDGAGVAIATGALGSFPTAAYACTINRTDISADVAGSITVDIWKAAGAIPTGANKISASAPVTLSAQQLNQNGSISGWTTGVSSGDVFGGTVASASTVTRVTVQIWCQ
jgi:hypothetical protein